MSPQKFSPATTAMGAAAAGAAEPLAEELGAAVELCDEHAAIASVVIAPRAARVHVARWRVRVGVGMVNVSSIGLNENDYRYLYQGEGRRHQWRRCQLQHISHPGSPDERPVGQPACEVSSEAT